MDEQLRKQIRMEILKSKFKSNSVEFNTDNIALIEFLNDAIMNSKEVSVVGINFITDNYVRIKLIKN